MELRDDAAMRVRAVVRQALQEEGRGAQSRLARALDVRPQTISKWLSGELPVNPKWFFAIDKALGLPAGTLAREGGLFEPLGLEGLDEAEMLKRWEALFPAAQERPVHHQKSVRREEPAEDEWMRERPEMPEGVIGIAALAGELSPEDRAKVEAYIKGLLDAGK